MNKSNCKQDDISEHIEKVLDMHREQVARDKISINKIVNVKYEFNKHQERFFDQQAPWYISSEAAPNEIKLKLEGMFKVLGKYCGSFLNEKINVLDVGFGSGVLIPFINKTFVNSNIHGIDLSQVQLNNLKERHPDVETHLGDISEFSSEDDFHLIICNACFGNFFSQQDGMNRMTEILAENGFIVISHPLGASFVAKLHSQDAKTVAHHLPVREDEIDQLCSSNGLTVREFINEELFYLLILQKNRK